MSYKDHPIYKAHERIGFPALHEWTQLRIMMTGDLEPIRALIPELRNEPFPHALLYEYITITKEEFKSHLKLVNFLEEKLRTVHNNGDGFWARVHPEGFDFFERERGIETNHNIVHTADEVLDLFIAAQWEYCK
jgi:hypothetical protein